MRPYGANVPAQLIPVPPDTVQTFLLTGGSSSQASDWQTSTGAVANASVAGVGYVRLTGMTSAGAALGFSANLLSTGAAVPTSGTSIASSGVSHPVLGQQTFQVPGASTGFSLAAFTSGYVMAEMWHK